MNDTATIRQALAVRRNVFNGLARMGFPVDVLTECSTAELQRMQAVALRLARTGQ